MLADIIELTPANFERLAAKRETTFRVHKEPTRQVDCEAQQEPVEDPGGAACSSGHRPPALERASAVSGNPRATRREMMPVRGAGTYR